MDIKIGLHDWCSVKLTKRGADILNHSQHPDDPRHEAGEVYEGQVWHMMHEFGTFVYSGSEPPFEDESISFYCQSYRDLRKAE